MRPNFVLPACRWLTRTSLIALACAAGTLPVHAADDDFLPVRDAYKVSTAVEPGQAVIRFDIAPGYYLYRERLGFVANAPGVTIGHPSLPVGLDHEDDYFGKQVIYRDVAKVGVPVTFAGAPADFDLHVKLQGCADAGLCYPPQDWVVKVQWPAGTAGATTAALAAAAQAETPAPAATPPAQSGGFDLRKLLGGGSGAKSEADFLPPDEAFVFSAASGSRDRVRLRWDIADDYYLYRDKVTVATTAPGVQLGSPAVPGGETKHDEYFGEQVVFHEEMQADLPVIAAADVTEVPLEVTYQGCADEGLCYPPIRKHVVVRLASADPASLTALTAPGGGDDVSPMRSEQDLLADKIRNGSLLMVLGLFFVSGLGLALTPCVWPMVPILSGIIVGAGSGTPVSRGRAFSLSLAYVLGMAFTYTVAGAAFAAAGQQAQAFFQKPWMIVVFAGLFVWLALGMFGVFTLQLPSALQSRISGLSDKQRQGTLLGTAVVGALSSLIVTACVAPPLVASLAVISQTGDVLRGGAALFALSLGMGAPLLLVGASAGQFLPKAGAWMDAVKQAFGVVMLGVAIWMLGRVLPGPVTLGLWAALAAGTGLWLLLRLGGGLRKGSWVRRAAGVAGVAYGVMLVAGAVAGRSDPLHPVDDLKAAFAPEADESAAGGQAEQRLAFQRIKSIADLDREVATARAAGRSVMLDFYADWCVSCKEMEEYTFTDATVHEALGSTVLLQADVTANDAEDQALLQRFGILGPPSILFFGPDGAERPDYRVVGFKPAGEFAPHVRRAVGPTDHS